MSEEDVEKKKEMPPTAAWSLTASAFDMRSAVFQIAQGLFLGVCAKKTPGSRLILLLIVPRLYYIQIL